MCQGGAFKSIKIPYKVEVFAQLDNFKPQGKKDVWHKSQDEIQSTL